MENTPPKPLCQRFCHFTTSGCVRRSCFAAPTRRKYSIVFSVVGGVGLTVSIPIFVHSGRAHHLGVAAPCEDFSEPCNSTTRPLSVNGTYCTCSQYNVNDTVELSPILTYVLDAGENILINSHNSDCDADAHACSGHVITLQHDELRTGMCELDPSDATDIKCKQPQPKIFAGGIPASGTYNFYGWMMNLPVMNFLAMA